MLETILWTLFTIAIFVAWFKYKKHKKPGKQREGRYPNERTKSIEEIRQNENKYRKPGGFGGF